MIQLFDIKRKNKEMKNPDKELFEEYKKISNKNQAEIFEEYKTKSIRNQ